MLTFLMKILLSVVFMPILSGEVAVTPHHPSWLVNYPPIFFHHNQSMGKLLDATNDPDIMKEFEGRAGDAIDGFTDGELVDVIEHFFWGRYFSYRYGSLTLASCMLMCM
jgi:hypothetical protein